MLTIRALAVAAIFAGAMVAAVPALASCDSIYNNTCKPIPSKEPPEAAAEPEKASKPLQITSRRQVSRKAARAERSAQTQRKRFGKKSGTRVLTLRQRRAKAVAAAPRERIKPAAIAVDDGEQASPPVRPARSAKPPPRRLLTSADPAASTGEATDLNAATDVLQPQSVATVPVTSPVANPVEQARPAPAARPAPNEVNEIDLAAAASPDPGNQSWMRTLILAFGGVLAVGSALRLLL